MIYLATDHRGFKLKEKIKQWLKEWGFEYADEGAFSYEPADDYPDFVHQAAKGVSGKPVENKGIILGASGQGEAMVANRHKGVRAAVYNSPNTDIVRLARLHNDANVLSLGTEFLSDLEVKEAVKLFLDSPFSGDERHRRRIKKIDSGA